MSPSNALLLNFTLEVNSPHSSLARCSNSPSLSAAVTATGTVTTTVGAIGAAAAGAGLGFAPLREEGVGGMMGFSPNATDIPFLLSFTLRMRSSTPPHSSCAASMSARMRRVWQGRSARKSSRPAITRRPHSSIDTTVPGRMTRRMG